MKHGSIKICALILVWYVTLTTGFTQENYFRQYEDRDYNKGKHLFDKGEYATAQKYLDRYLETNSSVQSIEKTEAAYYAALCAINLLNADAEYEVYQYTCNYPESPFLNELKFKLGISLFDQKKYQHAVDWLLQVDKTSLTTDELAEYYFKLGYSYFSKEDYDKARVAFYEIKDVDSKYYAPSIYYYAHINYVLGNYETAVENFKKLIDDETFGEIVPYYITQIYHLQKNYDAVIEYAPTLMEKVTPKRKAEVARIIGEAYFQRDKFSEAIQYLEIYASESGTTTSDDKYVLAYSYYKSGRLNDAIPLFEKISVNSTALSQNAQYYLADCYLKTGDKDKARVAFMGASRLDFDKIIKEDALFNYAKITFELSYSPFNEAINAFNEYLELYPASSRKEEAYAYLVSAYMNARNYKMALESLEKIKNKDNYLKAAYQKVAFYRGLELMNSLNTSAAMLMFEKSDQFSMYDVKLHARCSYWKGEIYYRNGELMSAMDNYKEFLASPTSSQTPEYITAHYNLGYCYYQSRDYPAALVWFKNFSALSGNARSQMVADNLNRIGDCYFMQSNYKTAIEFYDKNISTNISGVDYALFQKGLCLGVLANQDKKIQTMQQLITSYPGSSYVPEAYFEIGRSYMALQQQTKALASYTKVVDQYPNSSFVRKSLVQMGLIHYNANEGAQALVCYKRVISDYPGTPEVQDALMGIKNIYVDQDNVDGYFDYTKDLGEYANISLAEKDSLSFKAAENIYMNGDCNEAINRFKNYLQSYPQGRFILNANYYLGECYTKLNKKNEALQSFEVVTEKPTNNFSEQALLSSARIQFENKNYSEALKNYETLEMVAEVPENLTESRAGTMRCYYLMGDYSNTIIASKRLLDFDQVPPELQRESRFKLAMSLYNLDRKEEAATEFRKVAVEVNSPEGAESKYRVAEILYNANSIDKSQQEIFDFIDRNTPQQYWMAKAFILLADIYVKKNDNFQAVHTLQSIIDYYETPNDGIIDLAKQKKDLITAAQNKENSQPELKEMEIDLNNNNNAN